MHRLLAAGALIFSTPVFAQTSPTTAGMCFNRLGAIIVPDGRPDCEGDFERPRLGVLGRDEAGKPLYETYSEGQRTRETAIFGLKDGTGRIVVPASAGMTMFSPLTPDLVYAQKTTRYAFLIRLSDGKVRPIPYAHIVPIPAKFGTPLLLAQDFAAKPGVSSRTWILDADGNETGGSISDVSMPGYVRARDVGGGYLPMVHGGILEYHTKDAPFGAFKYANSLGEPVLPGKVLVTHSYIGLMAPVGSGPRLAGHVSEPVYYGVVGPSGQILPMAVGVKGITKLWNIWWIVRETTGGLRYELPWRADGRPDLAGPPVHTLYIDVLEKQGWALARDARGWNHLYGGAGRIWKTSDEAVVALDSGRRDLLAERAREAELARVAQAAARTRAIALLRADIESAKKSRPSELALESIYHRISFLGAMMNEIDIAGLPALPTPQERYCRAQPGGQCRGARGSAVAGPYTSQWSTAFSFDSMQYLRDQYASNCAAASLGRDRPCWTP